MPESIQRLGSPREPSSSLDGLVAALEMTSWMEAERTVRAVEPDTADEPENGHPH